MYRRFLPIIFCINVLYSNAFFSDKNAIIYVAGHNGLVGSAIVRKLTSLGFTNIITRSFKELDLRRQDAVEKFFEQQRPAYVFLAAAKVGGIIANSTYPAEFIYDNLAIETNVIHSAYKYGTKKLLFLGSSCIYPRMCPQPMREEYLLTSSLEETNEAYAVAKIAGIMLCKKYRFQYGCNFIACMPTNLYGPYDNYHPKNSHVLPALIRRIHEAKLNNAHQITIWGTGAVYREFLHVDDCANAAVFLMQNYDESEIVNVGTGKEVTIKELALLVKDAVGYQGNLVFDTTKPDGTPRKLLNVDKLKKLGWTAHIELRDGIRGTYQWFLDNQKSVMRR